MGPPPTTALGARARKSYASLPGFGSRPFDLRCKINNRSTYWLSDLPSSLASCSNAAFIAASTWLIRTALRDMVGPSRLTDSFGRFNMNHSESDMKPILCRARFILPFARRLDSIGHLRGATRMSLAAARNVAQVEQRNLSNKIGARQLHCRLLPAVHGSYRLPHLEDS